MNKKIFLPHINYTVTVKEFKKLEGFVPTKAYTEYIDSRNCILHLPKNIQGSMLCHEIVHVLQFICKARNMEFTLESEHMGYISQYLFMCVTGGRWDNRK